MKFNSEDLDTEIKRAKLELIKITAGIAAAVLIALGIASITGLAWLVWYALG